MTHTDSPPAVKLPGPRPGNQLWRALALISLILVSLPACSPVLDQAQLLDEIAAFTVDYIVTNKIGATSYTQPASVPWEVPPEKASFIVYAPYFAGSESAFELDLGQPTRAWWFTEGQLVAMGDAQAALAQYRQRREALVRGPWDYYEFGVRSVSANGKQAEVYVGYMCGPLCGIGEMYSLERDAAGKWEVTKTEMVWIS